MLLLTRRRRTISLSPTWKCGLFYSTWLRNVNAFMSEALPLIFVSGGKHNTYQSKSLFYSRWKGVLTLMSRCYDKLMLLGAAMNNKYFTSILWTIIFLHTTAIDRELHFFWLPLWSVSITDEQLPVTRYYLRTNKVWSNIIPYVSTRKSISIETNFFRTTSAS